MFRVIIAGSRDFADYARLESRCDAILSKQAGIVIVSGMADGADALGVVYAKSRDYPVIPYPAKWKELHHPDAVIKTARDGTKYDSFAGKRRNILMAENADALIAFWDGKSPGAKHMITSALKRNLKVRVIRY